MAQVSTVQSVKEAIAKVIGADALLAMETSGRLVVTRSELVGAGSSPRRSRNSVAAVSSMVKDKGFALHLARIRQAKERAVAAIGNVDGCAIVKSKHREAWQMILADASEPGKWRIQTFDARGFTGHMVFRDKQEAIEYAATHDYFERDDGALDRLFDTPAFQRGLFSADLIRRIGMGQITFEQGNAELAQYDQTQLALQSVAEMGAQAQAYVGGDNQVVVMLADRITKGSESAVFLHEITHVWGKSAMNPADWGRLIGRLKQWGLRPRQSIERRIHDAALSRLDTARVGAKLLDEELFAYAVEEAVKLGVKPSAAALEESAEGWLQQVVDTLERTLLSATQSSTLAASSFPQDLQQLVDLAYAMAQLESPARSRQIWGRLSPAQRERLNELLSSKGREHITSVIEAGSISGYMSGLQATVAAAPDSMENATAQEWLRWVRAQAARSGIDPTAGAFLALEAWLQAMGSARLSTENVVLFVDRGISWNVQEPDGEGANEWSARLRLNAHVQAIPDEIAQLRFRRETGDDGVRVLEIGQIEWLRPELRVLDAGAKLANFERQCRQAYAESLHESSWRGLDDKQGSMRLSARLAEMTALSDIVAHLNSQPQYTSLVLSLDKAKALAAALEGGRGWAPVVAHRLLLEAAVQGFDVLRLEPGPVLDAAKAMAGVGHLASHEIELTSALSQSLISGLPKFDVGSAEPASSRSLWYFSKLERALGCSPKRLEGQPARQWLHWLQGGGLSRLGVKEAELEWAGLTEWVQLQGDAPVFAAQLRAYVRANGVGVSEVMLSEDGADTMFERPIWDRATGEWVVYWSAGDEVARFDEVDQAWEYLGRNQGPSERPLLAHMRPEGALADRVKGISSYRELLLTLEAPRADRAPTVSGTFVSEWDSDRKDTLGVLAHLRVDERLGEGGQRVLMVHEIQSQWAAALESQQRLGASGVAGMPFAKTSHWLDLAMKRLVVLAAQEGYDAVAFASGASIVGRSAWVSGVDRLQWIVQPGEGTLAKMPMGRLVALGRDGEEILVKGPLRMSEIAHELGAGLANALLDAPAGELSASEIEQAVSGVKNFYDQVIPASLARVLKLVQAQDARSSSVAVPLNGKVQPLGGFVVSEALRSAFRDGGMKLPLFSRADGVLRNAHGDPLVVYRGEHSTDGQWLRRSLPGLKFSTAAVANIYAQRSSDRRDMGGEMAPRIMAAHLVMRRPFVNTPGSPFIEMSDVVAALGQDKALKIALDNAAAIQETSAWLEADDVGDSVEQFLARNPSEVTRFYVDAYRLLDDPKVVEWLMEAGYDGAIHCGNGAGAHETEYRVFSPEQVSPVWASDALLPEVPDTKARVEAFLDHWRELDEYGEVPIEESARFVGNLVREFAQSKGVVAEFAPWAPYGQTTGLQLTDLLADESGNGAGMEVMQELALLADQVGLALYLRPSGTRSHEFYERCGYEQSKGHFGFMFRPPSSEDEDGPGDGPGRPGPGGGVPAPATSWAEAQVPAFSFAGEAAQDAPVASLYLAKARIAKGDDADSVRAQTGWFCGPDGRWRFEIDDSSASVRVLDEALVNELASGHKATVALGDLLSHPRLMRAYPWLSGLEVSIEVGRSGAVFEASSVPGHDDRGRIVMGVAGAQEALSLSTLLHEVQHAIQRAEGFATGGTPSDLAWANGALRPHLLAQTQSLVEQLKPPSYELFWGEERTAQGEQAYAEFLKEWHSDDYQRRLSIASQRGAASRVYERLAGEVEARDVQARLDMGRAQRAAAAPALQDPEHELVVVLNGQEMRDVSGAARSAASPQSLEQVREIWAMLGIDHHLYEQGGLIRLSQIVVPKERRGQGLGTQALNALMAYADASGQRVALSPSTDFGASSKARLQRFYRRFGFVPNQGSRRDFTTTETMLREPKGPGFMDLRPNPSGQELRTYKVGDTTLVLSVSPFDPGVVHLSSLRTPVTKRGKGSARSAMQALLAQADRQGVSIQLIASALDSKTHQTRLGLFYRSLGFEVTGRKMNAWGHPEMVRHAKSPSNEPTAMPEMLEVDGVMRPTRNSRGIFIHPDIKAVERFWRWYAGGQQSPGLVDADGRPTVLYHGTVEDVQAFDWSRERVRAQEPVRAVFATNDAKVAGEFALYRSVWPGANVMPIYARTSKVLVIDGGGLPIRSVESAIDTARLAAWSMSRRGDVAQAEMIWADLEARFGVNLSGMEPSPQEGLRSYATRMGYDAIVFRDVRDDVGPEMPKASDIHVLLESASIKSATGNLGTYDLLEPGIHMSVPTRQEVGAAPEPSMWGLPQPSERMQWLGRGHNGLGPVYRGHGIEIHAVAEIAQDDFDDQVGFARFGLMGHASRCVPGTRSFAFKIVHAGSQDFLGSLVCDINESGDIVSVHDIAITPQGRGFGTRVLSHLVSNAPDNTIKIQEITSGSEEFWRRINVGYIDAYRDSTLDGPIGRRVERALSEGDAYRTGGGAFDDDGAPGGAAVDSAPAPQAGSVAGQWPDAQADGDRGRASVVGVAPEAEDGLAPMDSLSGVEVQDASEEDALVFADDLGLDFERVGRRWLQNERGADLKLYHGTNADFSEFGSNPRGIFFAEDPLKAATFTAIRKGGHPRVIEARININKVWEVIRYGDDVPYSQMIDQSVDALKKQGYDAMHCPDDGVWIVFDPKQIDILRHDIDQEVDEADEVAARVAAEMEDVRQLYAKAADWLKAPNGAPTRLSQRQWLLVRTDSFKAWFGDWQKDPVNASKALDENGEPKVYFHGSNEAGFTQFDTDGRRKTDGTGAFFASDSRMARGYSGGSEKTPVYLPEQIFKEPDLIDGLEIEKGILVSVVVSSQGRKAWSWFESEQQAREELELAADDPIESKEGYRVLVDGYEELVGDKPAVLDHLADMRTKEPGMYEVFLNIRDMVDIDWGGKNWDEGPQEDVWGIEDENGNQIDWAYSEEDRDTLLASNPGTTAKHRTQSVYYSSDDAARQARQMGADGVLLRNIWDTGPAGYAEDGDVCVVFEPENIKWADNVGTFDPGTSDIRFSMPVNEDVELPAKGGKKPLNLTLKAGHKGYFDAYVGKRRVGAICAWEDSRGEFVVMEVVVSAPYRRRGVATAMYRAVEEQAGRQLKPAVSLSDNGFEFWKAYRPEAVADDLRHRLDELIGRRGVKHGREGIITKASGGTATLTLPDGMHYTILRRELDDVLVPLETDDGPGDGPGGPGGSGGPGKRSADAAGDASEDAEPGEVVNIENEATDAVTGSPAFRAWFGDSKVLDADGKPLVVYHGTSADFDTFDDAKTGSNDRGLWGRGHYFSAVVENANSYALRQGEGARLIPAYLSIKNPLVLTTGSDLVIRLPDGTNYKNLVGPNLDGTKIKEMAISGGHDGVIQIKPNGLIGDAVVFSPSQIKSAIGNNGDFDAQNPDIRFSMPAAASEPTLTTGFQQWFSGSTVVGEDGRPLVVYHGTQASFTQFSEDFQGSTVYSEDVGFFFSNDPVEASGYATEDWEKDDPRPNVMPVYLALKNPLVVTLQNEQSPYDNPALWYDHEGREAVERAQELGHDSLVVVDERDDFLLDNGQKPTLYVAFKPEQIKSAIGNNGNFDVDSPDIRMSVATPPVFVEDIPNEHWLQGKVRDAMSRPRNSFGVPSMRSITGYFKGNVLVPVRWATQVPGMRDEQNRVRHDDLAAIRRIIQETGRFPLEKEGGAEYVPFLNIGHDGKPWVNEGSHRIMAAAAEGLDYIPVQLRYFDGGQRRAGKWSPDNLLEITDRVSREKALAEPVDPLASDWAKGLPLIERIEDGGRRGIYKVYHATTADVSEFVPGGNDPSSSGPAIWLSPYADHQAASHNTGLRGGQFREGANVMPLYARLERPLVIDDKGMLDWARQVFANGSQEFPQLITSEARAALTEEYDGIIFNGEALGWGARSSEVVVFDGVQLKSAIGNNGDFDGNNPDIRFSFAGQQAATANTFTLKQAKDRLASGQDSDEVREDTGWFKGVDGKWRFEINDASASLKNLRQDEDDLASGRAYRATSLSDVLEHPALFAAYPHLRSLDVIVHIEPGKVTKGSFEEGTAGDDLYFGRSPQIAVSASTEQEALGVLLHEIQHAIQLAEGFASGGSPALMEMDGVSSPNPDFIMALAKWNRFMRSSGYPAQQLMDPFADLVHNTEDLVIADVETQCIWLASALAMEEGVIAQKMLEVFGQDKPVLLKVFDTPSAHEQYRRLAGEVEARNVEARQRFSTSDVAEEDIIILMNGSPVQMLSAPVGHEQRHPQGPFVSALARAVDSLPAKSNTTDGWVQLINGLVKQGKVKEDEVVWTGVADWLFRMEAEQRRITREELAAYLDEHAVRVQEVVLQFQDVVPLDWGPWSDPLDDPYGERFVESAQGWRLVEDNEGNISVYDPEGEEVGGTVIGVDRAKEIAAKAHAGIEDAIVSTPRYSTYALPGGSNYREVLLKLAPNGPSPKISAELHELALANLNRQLTTVEAARRQELLRQLDAAEKAQGYKSNHWDEYNVVAHIRLNDRIDAQGRKTLFVEEIQSDWAQQGRKSGFFEDGAGERMPELLRQYDELNTRRRLLESSIAQGDDADPRVQVDVQAAIEVGGQMEALAAEMTRMRTAAKAAIPLGPFVGKTDGWLGLSLRRIMKMAVDGGYDNVAFVSGEQAADRFKLSKQVDEIEVFKVGYNTYDLRIDPIEGDRFYKRGLSGDSLADHVGKEMASVLVQAASQYEQADDAYRIALRKPGVPESVLDELLAQRDAVKTEFTGPDLKVGGTGMKAFYGSVLPAALKPLLRKFGGSPLADIELSGAVGASNEVIVDGLTVSDVLTGNRLYFAESADEAVQWAQSEGYTVVSAPTSQLGFVVTPKMREMLADGVPLFSFAGPQALTANLQSMAGAQARLEKGHDPEVVRQETGWFAGADGRLRFEIDDSQAFAKGTDAYGDLLMRWYHAGVQRTGDQAYKVRLGDVLYHAKLFDAYPGLAALEVQMMPAGVAARGRLVIENGQPSIIQINEFLDAKTWVNVALHELQHAIQEIERFEPGSSPADFAAADVGQAVDDQSLAAYKDRYRQAAGEVEARNVQARQNLNQRERQVTPPASTQDVADPILLGVRDKPSSQKLLERAAVLDMGDGVLRVQRAQVGGDRPRAATGEAGDGIYAYFPKSAAMRSYYAGKRGQFDEVSLWDIDLDASRVVDLTQPQNMAELLAYARGQFAQLARSMPGYVTPVVSAHNIQRFGRIVEGFVRAHRPWAGAWIIGHKGPGIPTSRQVVIADESAMLSAVERPSSRFVSEELPQPETDRTVEPDWMSMLFGEQTTSAPAPVQSEVEWSLDSAVLAQSLRAFSAQKQGEALEWASRRYKFNPKSVSLAGDGPRREETISVQRANESRRRKMVDSLMAQSTAATGLALKVEDGMDFATQWRAVEAAVERDIARNGGVGLAHGTKERMTQAYASTMLLGDAYGSFGDGTLACHLSQLVQAARGEVDSVAMSVNSVARDSKAFQLWCQGLPFVEEGWNDYGGGPGVFVAYHGTTHSDITVFKRTGNPDGFLGEGPYFTSSAKDASENYTGEGPDLLARIANAAEGYGDQFEEDDSAAQEMLNAYFSASGINEFVTGETTDAEFEELKESHGGEAINFAATRAIKGDSDGLVMKVFVRLSNPADTVHDQWLEAQWADDIAGAASAVGETEDDEIEEPLRDWTDLKGPLADWLQAAQIMVSDEHVFNAYAMAVMERVGEDGGVHMRDLFEMALEHFREFSNSQETSAGAVFRDIAKEAGYDGVVMSAWRHFGPKPDAYGRMMRSAMSGLDEATVHLVPFSSSQVKSSTGNSGAFDPSQADIRLSVPANGRKRVEGSGNRAAAASPGLAARAVHDALQALKGPLYEEVVESCGVGPFDGACLAVARALQPLLSGSEVVVLAGSDGVAQHAAVRFRGWLFDANGGQPESLYCAAYAQDEHLGPLQARPIRNGDLPDAVVDDPLQLRLRQMVESQARLHPAQQTDRIVGPAEQSVSQMGLKSALLTEVERLPMKLGLAQSWREQVGGLVKSGKVKASEVDWSGLDDWLGSLAGQKISRLQVCDFLSHEGLLLQEKRLEGDEVRFGQYAQRGASAYREILLTLPRRALANCEEIVAAYRRMYPHTRASDEDILNSDWVFENLSVAKAAHGGNPNYLSRHWPGVHNVLAHIRVSERHQPDGRRVLFVEELQSDWAGDARRNGIRVGARQYNVSDLELVSQDDYSWTITTQDGAWSSRVSRADYEFRGGLSRALSDSAVTASSKAFLDHKRVPDAPFIQSTQAWLSLALKRVITLAAQEGFDQVAFVSGEQAARMFSLDKRLSALRWERLATGKYRFDMQDLKSEQWSTGYFEAGDLEQTIGSDLARKIASNPDSSGTLVGDDLRVVSHGMRGFYEGIVPNVLKDVFARAGLDAQVGPVTLGADPAQQVRQVTRSRFEVAVGPEVKVFSEYGHALEYAEKFGSPPSVQTGFDVTPQMRARVETDALPLFSIPTATDQAPGPGEAQKTGQKSAPQVVYHVTPTRNLASILDRGLEPRVGERSRTMGEKVARSYHFVSAQAMDDALCGWLADAFDEDVNLAVVAVDVCGLTVEESPAGYEVQVLDPIDPARLCTVHSEIDALTSTRLLALASQAQETLHSRRLPSRDEGDRPALADHEAPQVAMSFAGATAKTADLDALSRAKRGAGGSFLPREVWQTQGWTVGADSKWRFEIDDSHAHVDLTMLRNIAQGNVCAGMPEVRSITYKVSQADDGQELFDVTLVPPSPQKLSDIASFSSVDADLVEDVLGKEMLARMRAGEGDEDLIGDFEPAKRFATPGYAFKGFNALPLDRVLHHPALFDAYPQLADILVTVNPDLQSAAAFVIQVCEAGEKAFDRRLIRLKSVEIGKPQLLSAVLHEVQHAIQEIEGFASGGSAESAARYERSMRYQMIEQALTRLYALKDRFPGTYKAYQDMQNHFYACLSAHGIDAFGDDGSLCDLMTLTRALQRVELPEQALRRHQLVDAYRHWMAQEVGEFGSPGMQAWSSAVSALSAARMASPEPGSSVYRRLAGEVEARNVQFRLAFDAAKRSELLPEDTADVSTQDQVFMPA